MNDKYYIEAYDQYYPNGGTDDLVGPYDSLDAAKAAAVINPNHTCILRVRENEIKTVAWWQGTGWSYAGDAAEKVAHPIWIVRELGMYIKGRYVTYQEASIALEQHRDLDREKYEIIEVEPGAVYGYEFPWHHDPT